MNKLKATVLKSGITVHTEDDGLFIEEVTDSLELRNYVVTCGNADMVSWFVSSYGRSYSRDHFEGSYSQTSHRYDDESIIEYIKDEPKLLKEFANSLRDKWTLLV
jgi:hypothetical protein